MYRQNSLSRRLMDIAVVVVVLTVPAVLAQGGKKGGGGGGSRISLSVALRDAVPADGVRSDCWQQPGSTCPYVDKEQRIVAEIKDNHFSLYQGRGLRSLWFDFSHCAEQNTSACTPPFTSGYAGALGNTTGYTQIATGGVTGTLGVGQVGNEKLIVEFHALDPANFNSETRWRFRMQPHEAPNSPAPTPCEGSSHLVVSHPDAATWTFISDGEGIGCLESRPAADANAPFVARGRYRMPVAFMATRK